MAARPGSVETVTLSIDADADGGAPLWHETPTVNIAQKSRDGQHNDDE
jgi:hypothetical protein